jgi:hypothetical protein
MEALILFGLITAYTAATTLVVWGMFLLMRFAESREAINGVRATGFARPDEVSQIRVRNRPKLVTYGSLKKAA